MWFNKTSWGYLIDHVLFFHNYLPLFFFRYGFQVLVGIESDRIFYQLEEADIRLRITHAIRTLESELVLIHILFYHMSLVLGRLKFRYARIAFFLIQRINAPEHIIESEIIAIILLDDFDGRTGNRDQMVSVGTQFFDKFFRKNIGALGMKRNNDPARFEHLLLRTPFDVL